MTARTFVGETLSVRHILDDALLSIETGLLRRVIKNGSHTEYSNTVTVRTGGRDPVNHNKRSIINVADNLFELHDDPMAVYDFRFRREAKLAIKQVLEAWQTTSIYSPARRNIDAVGALAIAVMDPKPADPCPGVVPEAFGFIPTDLRALASGIVDAPTKQEVTIPTGEYL